jgi:adenosylhomocysteine nucleosidase
MADRWNIGAYATDRGTVNVGGNAIGALHRDQPAPSPDGGASPPGRADVGILTVLTEELVAVVERLRRHNAYRSVQLAGGVQVHLAEATDDQGAPMKLAAMQTLDRGPRSATVAFERLQKLCRPPVVLLVGIAGGIRPDLAIGDVVIAEEVVYYDARREAADGPHRRGQTQPMTSALRHRLHEFFRRYGQGVPLGTGDRVRVHRGPIGSGDAVVTDSGSEILTFLRKFNEKTLAVETEAGGVGQAFYEHLDEEHALHGWLTIRGISDLADKAKGHDRHRFAAHRAAVVMDHLLPLLRLRTAP